MDREKFLEIKNLHVEYSSNDEAVYAVNGVSFILNKGETLGLVGETGAGKTTIAKAIMRILPDPPAKVTSGEILLDHRNLLKLSETEMLKIRGYEVSMIFQDPMTALNPVMSVGKQIAEVIALHNQVSEAEAEIKASQMLETVGIPASRFSEYPHQFSGGMKQRVVIAMALACNPRLLLADEPTTALDVTVQAQVLELIRNLQEQYQTAMILITHDFGVVAETCDNVAVIYAGEIVEYGSKSAVFKNAMHPYTIGLFASIPRMNGTMERLSPIPGLPPDPTALPPGCPFAPRCSLASKECENTVPMKEVEPGHYCKCLKCKKGA